MGWDEQNAWAAERGLRASSTLHWCPRQVLSKWCDERRLGERARAAGRTCVCQRPAVLELRDHARIWHSRSTGRVLTTEPYNATPERIEVFRRTVVECGLAVHVVEQGPWVDGVPMLVLYDAALTPEMLKL